MKENKMSDMENKTTDKEKDKGPLSARICQVLRDKDLKQKELAKALGVSANYIYLITSGRLVSISEPLAKLIETLYGYPSGWVLGGERKTASSEKDLLAGTIQKLEKMSDHDLLAVAEYMASIDGGKDEGDGNE
jgi:transcriptional regulator with XRE-family HTH domain